MTFNQQAAIELLKFFLALLAAGIGAWALSAGLEAFKERLARAREADSNRSGALRECVQALHDLNDALNRITWDLKNIGTVADARREALRDAVGVLDREVSWARALGLSTAVTDPLGEVVGAGSYICRNSQHWTSL